VKLVLKEQNSGQALETVNDFLQKDYTLHTVDTALPEALNAIWKHTNIHKDLKPEDAKHAAKDLTTIHSKLDTLTTPELTEQTLNIALNQNIPVYDALYIAAAQKLKATLYTADQKLYNTAQKTINAKLLKP
jgi:predicted nucleic acid-binding protein